MKKDELDIGTAGIVQVKTGEEYLPAMREECQEIIRRLSNEYPAPKDHYCYLKVLKNPHDFGSYLSVVAVFDAEDRDAADWAFNMEEVDLEILMEGWTPKSCPKCGVDKAECKCKNSTFQPYLVTADGTSG